MRDHGSRSLSACAILVLFGAMVMPAPALAQAQQRARQQERASLKERGPLEYITLDQRVIRRQVEIAITAAERAVETLSGATSVEDLAQAKDLSVKSYVLLRYAMHGVEFISNSEDRYSTYERLMARMALDAINEARMHHIAAQTALQNSIPSAADQQQQLADEALSELTESIPAAKKAVLFILR